MNKKIFLIAVFFITISLCQKSFAQWIFLTSDKESETFFMVPKVDPKNNLVFFSVSTSFNVMQELAESSDKKLKYFSKDETLILNCRKKVYSVPDNVFYSEPNRKGSIVYFSSEAPDRLRWFPLEENVVAQKLFDGLSSEQRGMCAKI